MTADVRDRLRQLTEAREKATPGPWATYEARGRDMSDEPYSCMGIRSMTALLPQVAQTEPLFWDDNENAQADAGAIVAEHNAVPWLVAALTAAVFDLHTSDEAETPFCNECGHTYPCATVRAVVAAAGDQP